MRSLTATVILTLMLLVAGAGGWLLLPATPLAGARGLTLNNACALVAAVLAVLACLGALFSLARCIGGLSRDVACITDDARADLVCPHPSLAPLVSSIQRAREHCHQTICLAGDRGRELEIRLKIAEAERQHAQSIIYSISDAVLVTDGYDDLVLANESAARAFNFEPLASRRAPIDQVVADATLVSLIRDMRQSRSRQGRRVVEHTVAAPSGSRTYKVTLSALPGHDDAASGVVAVLHDMTREREIAQMKNDFVSSVSHELRTPLASIRAYVEMLIDGEASDAKTCREFYDIIHTEANRLGRLIDNILNISRIEAGLVKVSKKPVSLMVLMKEAVEVIRPQARQRNIAIDEQISPAPYQTVADRDMLYEVVLNLLSNAVKYTPEGGRVAVRSQIDEARRIITARIIDTGVGIPQKDIPFVFDKFYRAEANNRMAKGTGLGLSLVRHIVETVHQGRVFVESEVGKGSTFGFELALAA